MASKDHLLRLIHCSVPRLGSSRFGDKIKICNICKSIDTWDSHLLCYQLYNELNLYKNSFHNTIAVSFVAFL